MSSHFYSNKNTESQTLFSVKWEIWDHRAVSRSYKPRGYDSERICHPSTPYLIFLYHSPLLLFLLRVGSRDLIKPQKWNHFGGGQKYKLVTFSLGIWGTAGIQITKWKSITFLLLLLLFAWLIILLKENHSANFPSLAFAFALFL